MINTISASPNFKAVYLYGSNYTKQQRNAANEIVKEFKKQPADKYSAKNYADYFERQGYDFVVSPNSDSESVELKAYSDNIRIDRYANSENNNPFLIGRYDEKNKFSINDVTGIVNKKVRNERWTIGIIALGIISILSPLLTKLTKPEQALKISDKIIITDLSKEAAADTIAKDTVQFIRKIKK